MDTLAVVFGTIGIVIALVKFVQWGQDKEDRIHFLESRVEDLERRTGIR